MKGSVRVQDPFVWRPRFGWEAEVGAVGARAGAEASGSRHAVERDWKKVKVGLCL